MTQICRHQFLTTILYADLLTIPLTSPLAGRVETVAEGFRFVEGPLWKDGVGLLFSDINGNTIYRWSPDSGVAVYLRPSGGSNGLAFDHQGRLLAALQGSRQVIRIEQNGTQTVLASLYQGKRLNSPNDLVVKSDGSIWFTDPPYGISSSLEELHFYGIFRISPSGNLQLLDKTLTRPNGIAFSPDESKLYVSDAEVRVISVASTLLFDNAAVSSYTSLGTSINNTSASCECALREIW